MVVSGIIVVVVAALLFLLTISLPNIAKFEGRIEAASETRLSWFRSIVRWASCAGTAEALAL
jgi:competence protein ComGC